MSKANLLGLGTLLAGLLITTASGMAQQGQGGGQGRGRGNFDPAQFQARMEENVKERLQASDDEWKVIQPLLAAVMEKQRAAGAGRFGGFGGRRGGPGGPGGGGPGAGPRGGGSPEVAALNEALDSSSASTADIKAKLAALRESRKKSEAELKKAREELRQVLSLKQEARCVVMGILD